MVLENRYTQMLNYWYSGNVVQSQNCKYTLIQKFCWKDYKSRREDKITYM